MDAFTVGFGVCLDETSDLLVAQSFGVSDQGNGGHKALDVPGEGANVSLVKIVDIEDQSALRVHIRAKILRVQVTVNPDLLGLVVQEGAGVLLGFEIVVKEAGRATIKGKSRGGHLAELALEGSWIAGKQFSKGIVEDIENLLATLLDAGLIGGHCWSL